MQILERILSGETVRSVLLENSFKDFLIDIEDALDWFNSKPQSADAPFEVSFNGENRLDFKFYKSVSQNAALEWCSNFLEEHLLFMNDFFYKWDYENAVDHFVVSALYKF